MEEKFFANVLKEDQVESHIELSTKLLNLG